MRPLATLLLAAIAGYASPQTPPIQPKTPNAKMPPALTLPAPTEIGAGKKPLTADEAVAIALKNQPIIGIARANFISAQGRTQQAASGLLPDFTASSSYNQSSLIHGSSGAGSPVGGQYNSSISVNQLLFDFGRTRDSVRQEEALERAFRHTLTRTQQTLALSVKQAFYNLVQNNDDLGIDNSNVANRQRQLDEAQARLDSGLGAPSDVVQAKTNLAAAMIALSTARDSQLLSQVALAQLLGIDPRTPITPADSTEAAVDPENDLTHLVDTALKNRPDLTAAQEQVTAAKYAVSFSQKGNLPKVTASVGVGSRGANDPLATETGTFGISVTWNFADSGFTDGAVKQAKGNEEAARQTLILVTQQVVTDVSQAYVDLQSALQRVDLASVEVANALEFVRIAEGRYTGGIGQFLDMTTAQSALVSAQRDQSQARLDVERVRARLKAAIGIQ
ncbi:MAG: TolC family protein [Fimbriimonadales bacterium]